jgi:hypothetical protein
MLRRIRRDRLPDPPKQKEFVLRAASLHPDTMLLSMTSIAASARFISGLSVLDERAVTVEQRSCLSPI